MSLKLAAVLLVVGLAVAQTPADRAAAQAGVARAASAIQAGQVSPQGTPAGDRVDVPWEVAPPASPVCMALNVRATPDCLAAFAMRPREGRASEYARVVVCGEPGSDGAALPACLTPLYATEEVVPYVAGQPRIRAKRADVDDASPCACAAAAPCEQLLDGKWLAAPRGLTLAPGAWRGAGCLRKTCVEEAGHDSMPEACR